MNKERIAAELPGAMVTWMERYGDHDLWEQVGRAVATDIGFRLLAPDPYDLSVAVRTLGRQPSARQAARVVRRYFELASAYGDLYARLRVTKSITPLSLPNDSEAA